MYDWNGDYIESSRNEITGRERSLRHYKRPTTMFRSNWDYRFNPQHAVNLNYLVNRTGNDRYDEVDSSFEPSNDVVCKHIIGLSYHQQLWQDKMENTFFVKDYVNHLNIRQTDLYWQTGSDKVKGESTGNYWGYGAGTRVSFGEPLALKASFEHSVRLPLARELLGNGSTIYANTALNPEKSDNVNLGVNILSFLFFTIYYSISQSLKQISMFSRLFCFAVNCSNAGGIIILREGTGKRLELPVNKYQGGM